MTTNQTNTDGTAPDYCMRIAVLKELIAGGKFHHATYRNQGTIWAGLYIYQSGGLRGFRLAGVFPVGFDQAAYELVSHTGVSNGSFGGG